MSYIAPQDWKPSPGISIEGEALDIVQSNASKSVLAGPGSGKTELLAQRAMYLLNTGGCPYPKRILAIAFKVDAARNLQERVEERCDELEAQRFESLTLHGFAKRLLDQFLEALPNNLCPTPDYDILFVNRDIWEDFRNRHGADVPQVRDYTNDKLADIVHDQLPKFDLEEPSIQQRLRELWWRDCLDQSGRSVLTFDMVMLLAIKILETQPTVLAAVRETYSHVFLDEFQDVTDKQYALIKAAFLESGAVLTAVGDTNQAIMKWAGALPDIFAKFNEDFGSESQKLAYNFRSNVKIVDLINSLATVFEDEPIQTFAARENDPVPENAIEGWIFETRKDEGSYIAEYIQQALAENPELAPEDFVILARLRVNDVEARLENHFQKRGLKLRNEARGFDGIAIQDLAKEPIFHFLISVLKMTTDMREDNPFQRCRDIIANTQGLDISTERGLAEALSVVQTLVANAEESITTQPNGTKGETISALLLPQERKTQFSRAYNEYRNPQYVEAVISAFNQFFNMCSKDESSWKNCIESLEGKGVVKLMTIHKCKGLEYHTVFLTEFNDDAFWGNDDDVNVFFVALSRARESIKFSFTKDSRGSSNIKHLVRELRTAGVTFQNKP